MKACFMLSPNETNVYRVTKSFLGVCHIKIIIEEIQSNVILFSQSEIFSISCYYTCMQSLINSTLQCGGT